MKRVLQKAFNNYLQAVKTNSKFKYQFKQCSPIVISDIDGVLLRGSDPIPNTSQALCKLRQLNIPVACLTNGGGMTQVAKAIKVNKSLGQKFFDGQSMFLNHSPLKPQLLKYSQLKGFILVTGSLQIKSILQQMKISNYVTTDELFMICSDPQNLRNLNIKQGNQQDNYENLKMKKMLIVQQIAQRLQISMSEIHSSYQKWAKQINAIFALNDVSPYQTTLQVFHNLFLQTQKNLQYLPPYFAAQNDTIWASRYHKPRIAFGPFNHILNAHCQHYSFDLKQKHYGKPTYQAFSYVEKIMIERHSNGILFFMIGDNPRGDIKGANEIGWQSILTKTGVHTSKQNDIQNPGTFFVQNFAEAAQIIIQVKKQIANSTN